MMKCCFNKKVLIGAGAVAVALLVVSPGLAVSALPLLIVAVCPLSMLLMMKTMRGGAQCHTAGAEQSADERAVELASLREEINVLKARQYVHKPDRVEVQVPGNGVPPALMSAPRSPARAKTQER